MPRTLSVAVENNFSGGLNTQATGVNFPSNACVDADNCIFHELGYVVRRPGFNFEQGYAVKTIDRTGSVITVFNWKNVTGDGAVNLAVKQVGATLYFYAPTPNESFSAGALSTTVDLEEFLTPTGSAATIPLAECQFTVGLGYLIVTHPYLQPFYLTYDLNTATITSKAIDIKVRDTEGVPDDLAIDERPDTLEDAHAYNLYNQGWFVNAGTYVSDFETSLNSYPSNSDVWWVYRNISTLAFDPSTVSVIYERGTSQAPRGHYVLDAFHMNREDASGFDAPITSSGRARPTTSAFFSGRVWYAGTNANGYESKIFFSRIIENKEQLGQCYQAADPTSEGSNQLVADDGGHLLIPGAGLIHRMIPVGSSLIVFASNGIWQITGSTGIGFTALDYSVNYLSSIRTISPWSFIDVDGVPLWWSTEGIYILSPKQSGFDIKSLTDSTIKELYLEIPLSSKIMARGSYDPRNHVVQWVYNETEKTSLQNKYNFSNVLNFNTLSAAFYPWSTNDSNVTINGVFLSEGFAAVPSILNVVADADPVKADGDNVIAISYGSFLLNSKNKFVVSYPDSGSYKFTFGESNYDGLLDWFSYDSLGIDYDSYFVAGYKMPTKGLQEFQNNYIFIFSDLSEIETTDFHFQSIWNFANSGNSGKWSSRQRIRHPQGNFDIKRNKLKVRGTGHAVQYKFSSIAQEPFHIIGWTVLESANARE